MSELTILMAMTVFVVVMGIATVQTTTVDIANGWFQIQPEVEAKFIKVW